MWKKLKGTKVYVIKFLKGDSETLIYFKINV